MRAAEAGKALGFENGRLRNRRLSVSLRIREVRVQKQAASPCRRRPPVDTATPVDSEPIPSRAGARRAGCNEMPSRARPGARRLDARVRSIERPEASLEAPRDRMLDGESSASRDLVRLMRPARSHSACGNPRSPEARPALGPRGSESSESPRRRRRTCCRWRP